MIGRILDILTVKLVRVGGTSMEPTISEGSWVLINRRAYSRTRKPKRFDIVRFEDPSKPGRWLLKRVIGLPGEEVCVNAGRLEINGSVVREPHLDGSSEAPVTKHEWWPSTNEYVLLGDNRAASRDSRKFGTVPVGAISGRVMRRPKSG